MRTQSYCLHGLYILTYTILEIKTEMKNIDLFKIKNLLHVSINNVRAQSLSTVQFSSVAQSCPTLCDPMDCSMPDFPDQLPNLLQLMSIKSVMPSRHLILYCLLLLLPSTFSSIRVFSSESVLHIRWPMYWSFSFSISPSNEYSGLISFRIEVLQP